MAGVTIKDLARIAQVHPSTISLALADDPRLAEATRRRVQLLASEHNYRPNAAARWLRRGRTGTIALVLWQETQASRLGRVQQQLLEVVSTATVLDYQVLVVAVTAERLLREPIDTIVGRTPVDGALFMGPTADRDGVARLIHSGLPVVHHGRRVLEGVDLPYVSADYRGGARAAVAHLAALGHRRIAFLGDPVPPPEVIAERELGYRDALAELGLAPTPDLELPFHLGGADAGRLVEHLRAGGATALFAVSAPAAVAAVRACRDHGVHVPRDLSIIAFDDSESLAQAAPPITVVRQPSDDIAAGATRLLLRLIDGQAVPDDERHQLLPVELIVRQSTAPPRTEPLA